MPSLSEWPFGSLITGVIINMYRAKNLSLGNTLLTVQTMDRYLAVPVIFIVLLPQLHVLLLE